MDGQLIDLLFPDGIPDDVKTDPNIKSYLDHLGKCTAEELSKEHKSLEDKNDIIVKMVKDLALNNYKTFVKTSHCYESVYNKFDDTQQKTITLDNYLLKLKTECQEMLHQWADVKEKRHRNTLAMVWNSRIMHHALELPQLMLSCIQNKLYEEALKLANHAKHLPNNIPAVKLLHDEVEKHRLTLMSALCQELRTDLELPLCMRIVRLLRTLNLINEEQLAVKFLQTRNAWFNSKLENIPDESSSQHLLETIEVSRSCLSNIATQYNLIFCSEDNSSDTGSSKLQFYYSWTNQKVCQFINILKKDLPNCRPSSLETIFTQCMYFGQSLGHIGTDFRGLIAPVFINVTVKRFSDLLKMTEITWLTDLQTFLKTNIKNVGMNQTHDEVDDIPSPVFEYYPLAKFCNGVMSALNDLGEYAPYAAADEITKCLHTTLHNASCALFSMYYQDDFKSYDEGDKKIFGQLCICFSTDVVPYVQRCLHKVYEPASIAAFIGVTITSLQKEMSVLFNRIQQATEWVEQNTDPDMKDLWLMGSIWPITIIVIAYLYFVLKLGPEFMKYRNPFNIDRIVMIYNAVQVLFSMYLVKEAFRLVWLRDDYRFYCIEKSKDDPEIANQQVITVWLFLASKFLDLLDTIFFILRKKQNQVTFLHVYHHTLVITVGWILTNFYPGGQAAFFGTINAFVHVIMYSYYFLTIINPEYKKAWWKKYLTTIQLVQFVITGIHGLITLFEPDCNYPRLIMLLAIPQDIFMFILFWDFYKTAYIKPKKLKQ